MLLLAAATAAAAPLTVYHVNPLHEGVLPLDMDTADVNGDAFFDLRSKVVPIECASNSSSSITSNCQNGEVVDPDLVVTKLTLSNTRRTFGEYGRCNICLPSGIDPFSGLPCDPNEYICSCGSFRSPKDCTNQTAVGSLNITKGAIAAQVSKSTHHPYLDHTTCQP